MAGRKRRRALVAVVGAALLLLLGEPVAVAGGVLAAGGAVLYATDPVRAVPEVVQTTTTRTLDYAAPSGCGDAVLYGWDRWGVSTGRGRPVECPRNYAVWPATANPAHLSVPRARVLTGQPVFVELTGATDAGWLTLTAPGAVVRPASAAIVVSSPNSGQGLFTVRAEAPAPSGAAPPTVAGQMVQATGAWVLRYARPGRYQIEIGQPGQPAVPATRQSPASPAIAPLPDWRHVSVTVDAAPPGSSFTATTEPTVPAGLAWWPGYGSGVGGSGIPAGGEVGRFTFRIAYPTGATGTGVWARMPGYTPLLSVRTLPAGPSARWTVTSRVSGVWPIPPPVYFHASSPVGPTAVGYPIRLGASVREAVPRARTRYRTEPLLLALSRPGPIGWDPSTQFSAPNLLPLAAGLLLLLLGVRRARRRLAART